MSAGAEALRARAARCATKAGRGAALQLLDSTIDWLAIESRHNPRPPWRKVREAGERIVRIADRMEAAERLDAIEAEVPA